MPLYRPADLKKFLNEIGASPKKSLSQNFLIDGNIIKKIVSTADISSSDTVLEIGPGPGVLTEALLNTGARVVAIEKDYLFAKALSRLQTEDQRLTVIEGDALTEDIDKLQQLTNPTSVKLVANLPYSITTALLTRFAPLTHWLSMISVCVQQEVAKRLTAKPGGSTIGSITYFLGFYGSAHYAFTIKRSSFYPAPDVDSAIFTLSLSPPDPNIDQEALFSLIRTCFQQRRKMIRKTALQAPLVAKECNVEEALLACNICPSSRPEQLTLDQWILLSKSICQ